MCAITNRCVALELSKLIGTHMLFPRDQDEKHGATGFDACTNGFGSCFDQYFLAIFPVLLEENVYIVPLCIRFM